MVNELFAVQKVFTFCCLSQWIIILCARIIAPRMWIVHIIVLRIARLVYALVSSAIVRRSLDQRVRRFLACVTSELMRSDGHITSDKRTAHCTTHTIIISGSVRYIYEHVLVGTHVENRSASGASGGEQNTSKRRLTVRCIAHTTTC